MAKPFNAHELTLLNQAVQAHALVENAHFLVAPGRTKVARKLIEREFLTDVTDQAGLWPNAGNWVVVRITKDQYDRARTLLAEAA